MRASTPFLISGVIFLASKVWISSFTPLLAKKLRCKKLINIIKVMLMPVNILHKEISPRTNQIHFNSTCTSSCWPRRYQRFPSAWAPPPGCPWWCLVGPWESGFRTVIPFWCCPQQTLLPAPEALPPRALGRWPFSWSAGLCLPLPPVSSVPPSRSSGHWHSARN